VVILGFNGGVRSGNWDAAAAVVRDGIVLAAAEEERFNRVKHAPGTLPAYAIRRCLKEAGLRIEDVDVAVFPGATYVNMTERLTSFFRFGFGHAPRIELIDHHLAHAASAFYTSGFESALIFTSDFSGDSLSATLSVGEGRRIRRLAEYRFPESLGLYYAMITQHLGFDFGEDEYKVMGLSSYGRDRLDMHWLLDSTSDGGYRFNQECLRRTTFPNEPGLSTQECLFNEVLIRHLGRPRIKGAAIEPMHEDIAASAQRQLERVVVNLLRARHEETGERRLCLAGGVAMNCVMNQRLAELEVFDRVFVPPVASDAGLAMGAALEYAAAHGEPAAGRLRTAALGPSYTNDQIRTALDEVQAPCQEIDDPAAVAAELVARGLITGWFQGRMEYGPRALGQRSILADPRRADMKERVNAVVKFREGFRPFAPSVTEEAAPAYFDRVFDAPFMTFTFNVPEARRAGIPAVTHVDGTARVQTVRSEDAPLYHRLLTELGRRTDVPVVLNTSFNIRGQPIVESPNQAISTFYGSGLDALVIGDFLLKKRP
jgi:carbamoyltransferase